MLISPISYVLHWCSLLSGSCPSPFFEIFYRVINFPFLSLSLIYALSLCNRNAGSPFSLIIGRYVFCHVMVLFGQWQIFVGILGGRITQHGKVYGCTSNGNLGMWFDIKFNGFFLQSMPQTPQFIWWEWEAWCIMGQGPVWFKCIDSL